MKRTTHKSSKGTKLYAKRAKDGKFKDIQTYKKAHGKDVKETSIEEELKLLRKIATTINKMLLSRDWAPATTWERLSVKWKKKYGR